MTGQHSPLSRRRHYVATPCGVSDPRRAGTRRSDGPFAPERHPLWWRVVRAITRPWLGRAR